MESLPNASEEIWSTAMEFDKYPSLRRLQSTQYLRCLRAHWLHEQAFFLFKLLTALTIFGTLSL